MHNIMRLSKAIELYNRVNPNINYGPYLIIMYNYQFTDYNKCEPLMQYINNWVNSGGGEQ